LKTPRLLKSVTRGAPSCESASDTDPPTTELAFFFGEPSKPYKTARLATSMGARRAGLAMDRSRCFDPLQGRHCLGHVWADIPGGAASLATALAQPLDEVLASHAVTCRLPEAGSARPLVVHPASRKEGDDEASGEGRATTMTTTFARGATDGGENGGPSQPKPRPPISLFGDGASVFNAPPAKMPKSDIVNLQSQLSGSGGAASSGGSPPSLASAEEDGNDGCCSTIASGRRCAH